jgi:protein gp37
MVDPKCQQHTFLILTKRAERMAGLLTGLLSNIFASHHDLAGESIPDNIWHGVSAENQQTADGRIPHLYLIPGKRFLSIEPMLGPIGLHWYGWKVSAHHRFGIETPRDGEIHAVLLGGESGKNARPMHPDWVRAVRDQCAEANVPFIFKQWGEWAPMGLLRANREDIYLDVDGSTLSVKSFVSGKGKNPVRVVRVGKKSAGRLLDGVVHDALPWDGEPECSAL